MRRIGKPTALGPLDENMEPDEDEDDAGAALDDGIELEDAATDALAASLAAAEL